MKKINLLFIVAFVIAIGTAFVSLSSSASDGKKEPAPTCCKKKAVKCDDTKKSGSGELIMESMSSQFISISPL